MYWLYLIIFILAIMIPDIIHGTDRLGLPHERIEELAIFLLGMFGFLAFIFKERQLKVQQREREKGQQRLQQTAKDLIESYNYIGEINRKMDMLMHIGIGLSERTGLSKKREKEIYQSIIEAATFLLKGKCATIIFFNTKINKIIKDCCLDEKCSNLDRNEGFFAMDENVTIKFTQDFVVFRSNKTINDIRAYLIIKSFDEFQSRDNNNQEILKYLASQALFLYSYLSKSSTDNNE